VRELIIHPRTRGQFYKGAPHRDVYEAALSRTRLPLVYNGDLFTAESCREIEQRCPGTRALMLGRGLIANPALAREYAGGAPLEIGELRAFHDDLLREYIERYPQNVVVPRIREIMKNMAGCFVQPEKPLKAIRKANSLSQYEEAVNRLFGEHPLHASPCFSPDL